MLLSRAHPAGRLLPLCLRARHRVRHDPARRLHNVGKHVPSVTSERCLRHQTARAATGRSSSSGGKSSDFASDLTAMIRDCPTLPSLVRLAERHSSSFNHIHAAAALAKAPKLAWRRQDAATMHGIKQLVSIAQQHLPACGARGLANMLWAIAKLRLSDEQFVSQIMKHARGKVSHFNPHDIANTAWAMATLKYQEPEFMQLLLGEASGMLQDFTSQGLANLVWALSKLQLQPDNPDFLPKLLAAACPMLPQFTGQDVANIALGLAYLRHHDPLFMQHMLAAAGPKLAAFNRQSLSNSTWAQATLNHSNTAFTDSLLQQVAMRVESLTYQEICTTLWSLCILDHDAAAAAPVVEAMLRAMGTGGKSPTPLDLVQVYQYLVTAEGRGHISAQLQQEGWYRRLRRDGQAAWAQNLKLAAPSETQRQVLAAVRLLPGCEDAQSQQVTEDGLLCMDIAVVLPAGRKVAVEVDGPWHVMSNAPQALVGPRAWRTRMLQDRGWAVVSVPAAQWSRLEGDAGRQHAYLLQRVDIAEA